MPSNINEESLKYKKKYYCQKDSEGHLATWL